MRLSNTQKAAVAMILALIVAWVIYPVLRPVKQDACASEILINAKGGKINLRAKTISVAAETQPVPLEKMTNQSQVVIDHLARLCRQNAAGQITGDQYYAAVQNLLRPAEKPPQLPQFNGAVGVTGLVDNRPFRKFVEGNAGKVVRLHLRIDASAYNPVGLHFLEKCYEGTDENGERISVFPKTMDNLYGKRLSLIETEQDNQEYELTDKQKSISCGHEITFISNNRNLSWSNDGPGFNHATIDGFFRVSVDQMGTSLTYRFEEVAGSVNDYAQAQE